jgi:hypothetical protein
MFTMLTVVRRSPEITPEEFRDSGATMTSPPYRLPHLDSRLHDTVLPRPSMNR